MKTMSTVVIGLLFGGGVMATGIDYVGTYTSAQVRMEINEAGEGAFAGVILVGDEILPFDARESAGALVGTIAIEEERTAFRATLSGATLTLTMENESHALRREGAVERPADGKASAARLRVNRVAIPDDQIRAFESRYGVVIPRGDFWYDNVSGAWGIDGGPTRGFTTPGMTLGGPLPADASRGDTGVFINGRELPVQDVVGLQQMGVPVARGRWWVDGQGNFGFEGIPVAGGNLFQFSRGRGGAYQRATAGGYIGGDGTTSYFFDPSTGASVMTGE